MALLGLLCLSSEDLNAKDASSAAASPAPASAPPPSSTLQVLNTLQPLQLGLPTVHLPAARVAKPYSHAFKASGGKPPYLYALKAGSLPDGLALSALGQLSGTTTAATVARSYPLTIEVTDDLQHQALQDYSLRVLAPGPSKAKPHLRRPLQPPSGSDRSSHCFKGCQK